MGAAMKPMLTAIRSALPVLALCAVATASAADDDIRYWVTVNLTSNEDGLALARASIRITGPDVYAMEYPEDAVASDLTGRHGITTDKWGRVIAILGPGEYRIVIQHEAHRTITGRFQVPHPENPDLISLEFDARMKMREDILARELRVTVHGKSRDANGREAVGPLKMANVEVLDENGRILEGTWTEANGKVTVESADLIVGDMIRVRARADGYRQQEKTLIVGSQQNSPNDPGFTNRTSGYDVASFILEAEGQRVPIIIEALAGETGLPVRGASVDITSLGTGTVAEGKTGGDGKTEVLYVPPGPEGSTFSSFRVKVTHPQFDEAWSDIPPELLVPRPEPRSYVVHLDPKPLVTGPRAHWTECQWLSFERFANWAGGKAADPDDYVESRDSASVKWEEERTVDERTVRIESYASILRLADREDAAERSRRIGDLGNRDPVQIGGYDGWQGKRFLWWIQGRISCHTRTSSRWDAIPSLDEARALAEEVAGALGDCSEDKH